jgi:signal peptidase II
MTRLLPYGLTALIAIVLDQVIKWLVETELPLREPVPVLTNLALYRTYNTGIAFSMLGGLSDVALIVIAVAVIFFLLWLAWRSEPHQWLSRIGFTLILGGAVGNLIDRIVHGHVIDYVLFYTQTWSFAVFNLADAFITVGAGLVVLDEVIGWWRQRRAARS